MYVLTVKTATKAVRVKNIPSLGSGIRLLQTQREQLGIKRARAVTINDAFIELDMLTFQLLDDDLDNIGSASIQPAKD